MADLVPLQQIQRLTSLVGAPYLNTFGSTETGLPPASGSLLAPGELPRSLSKRQSSWCLVRLLDDDGEVPDETPGEMTVRGPTLFSGYWGNDKANADIIAARNALDNAQSALATITGTEPAELDDVRTSLTTPNPDPANPNDWIDLAVKQNISLQSAEIGGRISQENVAINRAARVPTVDLTGQYGYNSTPSQFNGNETSNVAASIGLQVSVPLYTGGRINAKSRQAAYQYQQAQNEIENLRRTVQRGTANDYRGVMTSISEITAYGQSVESARTSLAATEAGYQVGTRTIVDVLNAQIQVFSAMANFLNARYSYLTNYLKLKADTGQLSLDDIKAVNAQLVPGKINALIAPLMIRSPDVVVSATVGPPSSGPSTVSV